MKVGVLIDMMATGGVQKAAIEEVKCLNKLGYDAELISLIKVKYNYQYEELLKDVRERRLFEEYPFPLKSGVKIPVFHFLNLLHFLSPYLATGIIKKSDYDIIIGHGTTTCFTAKAISRKLGIPYIAFVWDPMLYILKKVYSDTVLKLFFPAMIPLIRKLEEELIDESRQVAVCSNVHRDFLTQNYGRDCKIIHPGIYPGDSISSSGREYMLAFTRWDNDKKPKFLLEILRRVDGLNLVIAGVWTNQQDLLEFKDKIKEYNLENRVTIHNYLDRKLMEELCAKALFYIHPNFEAFGMGAIEAAGFGCPIVIPKGSGATEVFEHSRHGFFPEYENLDDFVKYINELVRHKDATIEMGRQAWEVARLNTWEAHTKKLMGLLA